MLTLKNLSTAALIIAFSDAVMAQSGAYGQCGGNNWTGPTTCISGYYCQWYSEWYSQCIPGTGSSSSSSSSSRASSTSTRASSTSSSSSASASATGLRGLNKLAKAKGRYFGTAVDAIWSNTDTAYLALSSNPDEFGFVTPGNAMKWYTIEPTQNTFVYTNSDYTVAWATANGQRVRGHTFVWHSQLASWVTATTWTSDQLKAIIQNHIANEGGHFAGKLYAWDVLNEILNEDGTWRTSVFYTTIGSDYVTVALQAARAADSTAKLYINDYNIEGVSTKSTAYYNLAVSLLAAGTPLDGIGFQGHLIVGSVPTTIPTNIARFAALGLDIAITELDIRYTLPATDALIAQQATDYATVVSACVGNARCVGVTTWDTSDDYSWIPSVFSGQGNALLFDSSKVPKPAYYSVANVLAAATVSGPL